MLQFAAVVSVFALAASKFSYDRTAVEIPEYVSRYAPYMYLYSEERYLPSSIEDYVAHFTLSSASKNYTEAPRLSDLSSAAAKIRELEGPDTPIYLTALEQWDKEPSWLMGELPRVWNGLEEHAPATCIVVDKGDYVDAFWFYFYAFNLGPFVMGHGPFGDHLGDWEHSLVRFNATTGEPIIVWMSAHGGGTAYWYDSFDHIDTRPVLFAARGTHAQYVSSGAHSHDIPWHMLSDFTDRGALWDPAANFVAYTFDGSVVHPANGTVAGREKAWDDWLLFDGCWGNRQLASDDPRQQWSPWQWRIIDGPLGPLFKNLMRDKPCERSKWWNVFKTCRIRNRITPGEGLDSDMSGCFALFDRLPAILHPFIRLITGGGWLCFWLDRLWG